MVFKPNTSKKKSVTRDTKNKNEDEVIMHQMYMHEYKMTIMARSIDKRRFFSFEASPHHKIVFIPCPNGGYSMKFIFVKTTDDTPLDTAPPAEIEMDIPIPVPENTSVKQSGDASTPSSNGIVEQSEDDVI